MTHTKVNGMVSSDSDATKGVSNLPTPPPQQPDTLIRNPEPDGIYPRCVWCGGENYGPAVINYSKGEIPCASVNDCGKYLPKKYIKL